MLMVIILHTKTHGLKGVVPEFTDGMYWILNFLHMFSIVAVNCFVLISGYFLSASRFSAKRLVKLWFQTEVFSVGIFMLLCFLPSADTTFGFGKLLSYVLPVMSNSYWFFTCYFVLIILSPFLNRFINSAEQKEFKKLLLVLLGVFVGVSSLDIWNDFFGTARGYSSVWFVILYLVAAYIRRFGLPKKPYGIFYVLISVLSVFIYAGLDFLSPRLELFSLARGVLLRYNSITVFASSVCLFMFFINHPLNCKTIGTKIITGLSASSFGVYLFHDHTEMRSFLWNNVVKLYEKIDNPPKYFLSIAVCLISFFIIGTILSRLITFFINSAEKLLTKAKKSSYKSPAEQVP